MLTGILDISYGLPSVYVIFQTSYKDLKRKACSMDIFRELTLKETSTVTTNFRRTDFNYI